MTPEYVSALDEDAICKAAFDLLFAFDEVISLGYKENVTVAQVKQNTEVRCPGQAHEHQTTCHAAVQHLQLARQAVSLRTCGSGACVLGMCSCCT